MSSPVLRKSANLIASSCAAAHRVTHRWPAASFPPNDPDRQEAASPIQSCVYSASIQKTERLEERCLPAPRVAPNADAAARRPTSRSTSAQPQLTSHAVFFSDDIDSRPASIAETIRRPFILRAKYGTPGNWALDLFTLPHNAARAECADLYNILESIQARSNVVSGAELDEFARWWDVFEGFLIDYFDFEADVLFAWVFPNAVVSAAERALPEIFAKKGKTESMLKEALLAKKEPLLESLRQISGTFELRRNVDTSDVFHTILEGVNDFVPKLIEYFHVEERNLPPILSHFHPASAKDAIVKKQISYIKQGEAAYMNLAILTRWMDKLEREKWVRSNLRGMNRFMFPRWDRRCEKNHGHIPFKFHRRLLRSVRHVAASRIRRRTEFGEEIDDLSYGSFAPSHNGSFRSLNLALRPKLGPAFTSEQRKERSSTGSNRLRKRSAMTVRRTTAK